MRKGNFNIKGITLLSILFFSLLASCVSLPSYPADWGEIITCENNTSGKTIDGIYSGNSSGCMNNELSCNLGYILFGIRGDSVSIKTKENGDIVLQALIEQNEVLHELTLEKNKDYEVDNCWIKIKYGKFVTEGAWILYERKSIDIWLNENEELIVRRKEVVVDDVLFMPFYTNVHHWFRFKKIIH